jgi:hypothetical protein
MEEESVVIEAPAAGLDVSQAQFEQEGQEGQEGGQELVQEEDGQEPDQEEVSNPAKEVFPVFPPSERVVIYRDPADAKDESMAHLDVSAVNESMCSNMTNMEDEMRKREQVVVSLDIDFLERFARYEHDVEVLKAASADSGRELKSIESGLGETVARAKDFGTKMMKFIQEQEAWNRELQQALNSCNMQLAAVGAKNGALPPEFAETLSKQIDQGLMNEIKALKKENSSLRESVESMERAVEAEREKGRKHMADMQRRFEELESKVLRGPLSWEFKGLSPVKNSASNSPAKGAVASRGSDLKSLESKVRSVAAPGSVTTPGGSRGRGKPLGPAGGPAGKDPLDKKGLTTRTPTAVPARPHSALGGRTSGSGSASNSARRTVGKENVGKYGLPTPKSSKQRKPQPQALEKPVGEKEKPKAPGTAAKSQAPAPKVTRN